MGRAYIAPILEPANFIEFEVPLSSQAFTGYESPITPVAFSEAMLRLVQNDSVSRFRISSVVVTPAVTAASAANNVAPITRARLSSWAGNRFEWSDVDKQLRIRWDDTFMKEGMWFRRIGSETISDTITRLIGTGPTGFMFSLTASDSGVAPSAPVLANIKFRVVWTDVSSV